jgi:hypothetical protein
MKLVNIDVCRNTIAYFVGASLKNQYNFIASMFVRKTIVYFVKALLRNQ